jgi:large subunit ribosomal protein L18
MNRIAHALNNRLLRKKRIRSTISGTTERPRLTVSISNRHIIAQIIDDTKHSTLAYASTLNGKDKTKPMTGKAADVGTEIAKKAKAAKINKIVFDRNGHIYHGRIKALADAARAEGLEF